MMQDLPSAADGDRPLDQEGDRKALPKAEPPIHGPAAVLSLRQAMRRARFDDAERSGAVADLRSARLGRLEVLHEALKPLIAQLPDDVDCFDIGIMPGSNPRLFIDMIGFVEMARDPRVYLFLQDTRHGRVKLAASESVEKIVEAATHYVARRLLERDKALASDDAEPRPIRPAPSERGAVKTVALAKADRAKADGAKPDRAKTELAKTVLAKTDRGVSAPASPTQILGIAFAFLIDVLGSIAFFSLLAFAGWVIWSTYKH